MARQNFSGGGPWEAKIGYSRTVKAGSLVLVSGCTAMKDGALVGKDDAYAQAVQALKNIETALALAGATFNDVVRSRVYIVGNNFDAIGKAHGEVFGEIRPANTTVIVSGLANPDMLVEIEVDAVVAN